MRLPLPCHLWYASFSSSLKAKGDSGNLHCGWSWFLFTWPHGGLCCRELPRDAFTTIYSSVIMSALLAYIAIAFFAYVYSILFRDKQEDLENNEKVLVKQDENPEKQCEDSDKHKREDQHEDSDKHKREDQHEVLMLLATFVVTITYVAGLNPPGGFWSNTQYGHRVSDPILQDHNSSRYQAFFVCNTTAFVASLLIIMLLLDKKLILSLPAKKLKSVRFVTLYGFIIITLFGLVGAYAAGSCRELDTTTYVVCLIGAVLGYIFLQVVITRAITESAPEKLKDLRNFFVGSENVSVNRYSRFLLQRHTLEAAMLLDLFGLIGAYAAGSCRDVSTSIYVVALVGAVLIYVVIHIVFFTLDHKENQGDDNLLDNRREVLLLLAILVAALTYQAGLTPPGGFWSADDNLGHHEGFPVLLDNYPPRYRAFFYCNATSFTASVALIVLLVNPNLYKPGIRCFALYVCMVAGAGTAEPSEIIADDTDTESAGNHKEKTEKELQDGKNCQEKSEKDLREYLMLLGVVAASVTYQTRLKPPGGLWQDNSNGHTAGNSVLHDINRSRYHTFFYSNSTSFMASIVVVVLLLPNTLHNHKLQLWAMHTAILLNMLGLLVAYAAGSTREWETSRNVIFLVIPVLVYIAAYAAWSFYKKNKQCQRGSSTSTN
ncbi:hypothetical protein ACQ4PT_009160 [Festuca glaucescens]